MKEFELESMESVEKFIREIESGARQDLIPKMRNSVFVIVVLDPNNDLFLALQIGLALLLDKPLFIVAVDGVWISPRLRSIAETVVEGGSMSDPGMQDKLRAAVEAYLMKQRPQ